MEQEILAGNKLISEFACIKNKDESIYSATSGGYPEGTMHFDLHRCPINTLYPFDHEYAYRYNGKWNTDWDWIMPVVEKIRLDPSSKLLLPKNNIPDSILPYIESVRPISKALLNLNIEELWQAVVTWIKWYNKNKNESK